MQLRLSVLARNRTFSKSMQRVRLSLQSLFDEFQGVALDHPIHEAILVGITDDKGPEFFEEVKNSDGFFQILSGCRQLGTDEELTKEVFEILRRVVEKCPFAVPDRERFAALFSRFQNQL